MTPFDRSTCGYKCMHCTPSSTSGGACTSCPPVPTPLKQSEQNKSEIRDHVNQENHVFNSEKAKIIGRESDKTTRWIREAVKI